MKNNIPIIDNRNRSTVYVLSGEMIKISGDLEIPGLLLRMDAELEEAHATFQLAAVTWDFIYYIDEHESDDTAFTVMLNRAMELVSDNFFAANDLSDIVALNEGLLWMSETVKYWQLRQYIKPEQITAEIKTMLEAVDIDHLTAEERGIFFAYFNAGPVKYTKPEALMAVLSNNLDQDEFSEQLAVIEKIIAANKD